MLNLTECEDLTILPESIGKMSNLLELYLCGCKGLTRLPDTLGNLTQLQKLRVDYCENLVELPQSTGLLSQLSRFDLRYCHKWEWTKASQISLLHELKQHGCSEILLPDERPYHGKYSTEYCSSGTAGCHGCGLKGISTKCWHCDICPEFDLCESCYERRHELEQRRLQSEQEVECWDCDDCEDEDYLCESCYERNEGLLKELREHVVDHPMTAITVL